METADSLSVQDLVCGDCGKIFHHEKLAEFQDHKTRCKPVKKFSCDICGRGFVFKHGLKAHVTRHDNPQFFPCSVCGKVFNYKASLVAHSKLHKSDDEAAALHECKTCGKKYVYKCSLVNHMKIHSSGNALLCLGCGKLFYKQWMIYRHRRNCQKYIDLQKTKQAETMAHSKQVKKELQEDIHVNESGGASSEQPQGHKCQMCDKSFLVRQHLDKHVDKCHNPFVGTMDSGDELDDQEDATEAEIHSSMAGESKETSSSVHQGETVARDGPLCYHCPYCNHATFQLRSLQVHARSNHPDKPLGSELLRQTILVSTQAETYVCPYCSKEFTEELHMQVHVTCDHKEADSSQKKDRQMLAGLGARSTLKYCCSTCFLGYGTRIELHRHKLLHRIRSDRRRKHGKTAAHAPHSTQFRRAEKGTGVTKRHSRTLKHNVMPYIESCRVDGRLKFTCPECEQIFSRYLDARSHLLLKHKCLSVGKVRKHFSSFQCFYCGYDSSKKEYIELHIRRAHGPRPTEGREKTQSECSGNDTMDTAGTLDTSSVMETEDTVEDIKDTVMKTRDTGTVMEGASETTGTIKTKSRGTGTNGIRCHTCDREFSTPSSLNRHKRTKHKEPFSGQRSSAQSRPVPGKSTAHGSTRSVIRTVRESPSAVKVTVDESTASEENGVSWNANNTLLLECDIVSDNGESDQESVLNKRKDKKKKAGEKNQTTAVLVGKRNRKTEVSVLSPRRSVRMKNTESDIDDHLGYQCEICLEKISSQKDIYNHLKQEHFKRLIYTCDICKAEFGRCVTVKKHLEELHHNHDADKFGMKHIITLEKLEEKRKNKIKGLARVKSTNLSEKQKDGSKGKTAAVDTAAAAKDVLQKLICKCGVCGEHFDGKKDFVSHVETVHNKSVSFFCRLCTGGTTTFDHLDDLVSHLTLQHPRQRYDEADMTCEVSIGTESSQDHMKLRGQPSEPATAEKRIRGKRKPTALDSSAVLIKNPEQVSSAVLKKKPADEPVASEKYLCSVCNQKFSREASLKNHRRIAHGSEPLIEDSDSKQGTPVKVSKTQSPTVTKSEPKKGAKGQKKGAKESIKKKEQKSDGSGTSKTLVVASQNRKCYQCPYCRYIVTVFNTFKKHVAGHTGKADAECNWEDMVFDEAKLGEREVNSWGHFKCLYCRKVTPNMIVLVNHERMAHQVKVPNFTKTVVNLKSLEGASKTGSGTSADCESPGKDDDTECSAVSGGDSEEGKPSSTAEETEAAEEKEIICLKCPYCDLLADTLARLRKHVKKCHKNESYILLDPTELKMRLKGHEKKERNASGLFKCDLCKTSLKTFVGLLNHQRIMHGKDAAYAYSTKPGAQDDDNKDIEAETLECPKCSVVFPDLDALLEHNVVVHRKIREGCRTFIKCPYCSYVTPQLGNVRRHVSCTHPGKPQTIDWRQHRVPAVEPDGEIPFSDGKVLFSRGKYKCTVCGAAFRYLSTVLNHQWQKHGLVRDSSKPEKDSVREEKLAKESAAEMEDTGVAEMDDTGMSDSARTADESNVDEAEIVAERTCIKCPYCDYISLHLANTKRHISSTHTDKKSLSIDWSTCRVPVASLQEREQIEIGVDRYQCSKCEQMFSGLAALRTHERKMHDSLGSAAIPRSVHTLRNSLATELGMGVSYVCDTLCCGRTCDSKQELARHKSKTHEETLVFVCSKCDALFSTIKGLKNHLRDGHGDYLNLEFIIKNTSFMKDRETIEMFVCNSCSEVFPGGQILEAHDCLPVTKQFYCPYCDTQDTDMVRMKDHISSEHGRHIAQKDHKGAATGEIVNLAPDADPEDLGDLGDLATPADTAGHVTCADTRDLATDANTGDLTPNAGTVLHDAEAQIPPEVAGTVAVSLEESGASETVAVPAEERHTQSTPGTSFLQLLNALETQVAHDNQERTDSDAPMLLQTGPQAEGTHSSGMDEASADNFVGSLEIPAGQMEEEIVHATSEMENGTPDSFTCEKCKKVFVDRKSLKYHMRLHFYYKPCVCGECGKAYELPRRLRQHMLLHFEGAYRCKVCKKEFMYPSDLERHQFMHTGERPFQCDLCGNRYCDVKAVKRHKRIKHSGDTGDPAPDSNKECMCEKCGMIFKSKRLLISHTNKEHLVNLLKCEICNVNYRTKVAYRRHMRQGRHLPERYDKYLLQARELDERISVSQHDRHALKSVYQSLRTDSGASDKRFKCSLCGKSFDKPKYINAHMRRFHTAEAEKPYNCNICGRGFVRMNELKNHGRIHADIRPYTCRICQKSFKQVAHVREHMRSHFNTPSVACKLCNRQFKMQNSLKGHVLNHCLEEPYKCPICQNGSFKAIHPLIRHCRSHYFTDYELGTGGQYSCNMCSKQLSSIDDVCKHLLSHTKDPVFKCENCSKSFEKYVDLYFHKDRECSFTDKEMRLAGQSNAPPRTGTAELAGESWEDIKDQYDTDERLVNLVYGGDSSTVKSVARKRSVSEEVYDEEEDDGEDSNEEIYTGEDAGQDYSSAKQDGELKAETDLQGSRKPSKNDPYIYRTVDTVGNNIVVCVVDDMEPAQAQKRDQVYSAVLQPDGSYAIVIDRPQDKGQVSTPDVPVPVAMQPLSHVAGQSTKPQGAQVVQSVTMETESPEQSRLTGRDQGPHAGFVGPHQSTSVGHERTGKSTDDEMKQQSVVAATALGRQAVTMETADAVLGSEPKAQTAQTQNYLKLNQSSSQDWVTASNDLDNTQATEAITSLLSGEKKDSESETQIIEVMEQTESGETNVVYYQIPKSAEINWNLVEEMDIKDIEELYETEEVSSSKTAVQVKEEVIDDMEMDDSLGPESEAEEKELATAIVEKPDMGQSRISFNYKIKPRPEAAYKPFPCPQCGKCFQTKKYMQSHLRRHRPDHEQTYQCDICGKGFSSKQTMLQHERVHSGAKPFKCNDCGKAFKQLGHLMCHVRIHKNYRPHVCEICKEGFCTGSQLKKHLATHNTEKLFPCSKCSKAFDTEWLLLRHRVTHASKAKKEKVLKACKGESTLEANDGDNSEPENNKKPPKARVKVAGRYICDVCGRMFTTSYALKLHWDRTHRTEKNFQCTHCEKTCTSKAILKLHMLNHKESSPCEICGKMIRNLANHVREMHHPENTDYKCTKCKKQFHNKRQITGHIAICCPEILI